MANYLKGCLLPLIMVKAVIFDSWGTVIENGIHPSPAKQVRYFLRVRLPFSEFVTTFEDAFMTKEYDSLNQAFEQVVKDFNLRIPEFVYEKLVGMWNKNAILSKMYEETEETIKKLKEEGYKVFLLTNSDKFSYEQINDKFKLEKLFDKTYPSFKTGKLKLNPESFRNILEDNGLEKEDVIMIGDCLISDIGAADKAEVKSILLDRRDSREYDNKVKSLSELPDKLKEMQ